VQISAIPCQDQPRKADANPIGDHSSHSSCCVSSFALLAHCIVEKVANHGVQGAYTMDEDSWRGISSEAKELIRRLLAVNPAARPSANEVYNIFCENLLFEFFEVK
jgi:serine/threonine protein kinase